MAKQKNEKGRYKAVGPKKPPKPTRMQRLWEQYQQGKTTTKIGEIEQRSTLLWAAKWLRIKAHANGVNPDALLSYRAFVKMANDLAEINRGPGTSNTKERKILDLVDEYILAFKAGKPMVPPAEPIAATKTDETVIEPSGNFATLKVDPEKQKAGAEKKVKREKPADLEKADPAPAPESTDPKELDPTDSLLAALKADREPAGAEQRIAFAEAKRVSAELPGLLDREVVKSIVQVVRNQSGDEQRIHDIVSRLIEALKDRERREQVKKVSQSKVTAQYQEMSQSDWKGPLPKTGKHQNGFFVPEDDWTLVPRLSGRDARIPDGVQVRRLMPSGRLVGRIAVGGEIDEALGGAGATAAPEPESKPAPTRSPLNPEPKAPRPDPADAAPHEKDPADQVAPPAEQVTRPDPHKKDPADQVRRPPADDLAHDSSIKVNAKRFAATRGVLREAFTDWAEDSLRSTGFFGRELADRIPWMTTEIEDDHPHKKDVARRFAAQSVLSATSRTGYLGRSIGFRVAQRLDTTLVNKFDKRLARAEAEKMRLSNEELKILRRAIDESLTTDQLYQELVDHGFSTSVARKYVRELRDAKPGDYDRSLEMAHHAEVEKMARGRAGHLVRTYHNMGMTARQIARKMGTLDHKNVDAIREHLGLRPHRGEGRKEGVRFGIRENWTDPKATGLADQPPPDHAPRPTQTAAGSAAEHSQVIRSNAAADAKSSAGESVDQIKGEVVSGVEKVLQRLDTMLGLVKQMVSLERSDGDGPPRATGEVPSQPDAERKGGVLSWLWGKLSPKQKAVAGAVAVGAGVAGAAVLGSTARAKASTGEQAMARIGPDDQPVPQAEQETQSATPETTTPSQERKVEGRELLFKADEIIFEASKFKFDEDGEGVVSGADAVAEPAAPKTDEPLTKDDAEAAAKDKAEIKDRQPDGAPSVEAPKVEPPAPKAEPQAQSAQPAAKPAVTGGLGNLTAKPNDPNQRAVDAQVNGASPSGNLGNLTAKPSDPNQRNVDAQVNGPTPGGNLGNLTAKPSDPNQNAIDAQVNGPAPTGRLGPTQAPPSSPAPTQAPPEPAGESAGERAGSAIADASKAADAERVAKDWDRLESIGGGLDALKAGRDPATAPPRQMRPDYARRPGEAPTPAAENPRFGGEEAAPPTDADRAPPPDKSFGALGGPAQSGPYGGLTLPRMEPAPFGALAKPDGAGPYGGLVLPRQSPFGGIADAPGNKPYGDLVLPRVPAPAAPSPYGDVQRAVPGLDQPPADFAGAPRWSPPPVAMPADMQLQPRFTGSELNALSTAQAAAELAPPIPAPSEDKLKENPKLYDNMWETQWAEPPPQTSRKDHFHTDFPGLGNQVNSPFEGMGH